jgi:hypothetical protein
MNGFGRPEIIHHRRNTMALLQETPTEYGVEVDIRSWGDRLIVTHDPYTDGEDFKEWIAGYQHGSLILNVKEEGLEERLLEILAMAGLQHFFFLDQSFPFLMRTARAGEERCAVRVSEYESVETAIALAGMVRWIWLDCFTPSPFPVDQYLRLVDSGFSICAVSPELQGRSAELEIPRLRAHFEENALPLTAVCTKAPHLWT